MRNNFRDDQSTGSIETSGFSDDDENEDQYDQEEESAPMAPIQGWDVFEVGYFKVQIENGAKNIRLAQNIAFTKKSTTFSNLYETW